MEQSNIDSQILADQLHLARFENRYKVDIYFFGNIVIFLFCWFLLISGIYELFRTFSTVLTVMVMIVVGISGIIMTSHSLILQYRGIKLLKISEPSDILQFLQKYGTITEGNIDGITGVRRRRYVYSFNHKSRSIRGHFYSNKLDNKTKANQIQILHWEGIVHIPLIEMKSSI